jgi:hypothetical protein
MAVDLKKLMGVHLAETAGQGGSVFYTWPEGHTLFYICPPTDEMKGLPYIKVLLHYSVGGKTVVCLHEDNEVVRNPAIQEWLKKRNIEIPEGCGCPVCELDPAALPPGIDLEKYEKMEQTASFYFPIVPWATVESGSAVLLPDNERTPRLITPGYGKIYNAICDGFQAEGDITDPEAARLIHVVRRGVGFKTKYPTVELYGETLRNPIRIPKPIRVAVAQDVRPGGECDPFRVLSNNIRPRGEIEKLLRGDRVETRRAEADPGKPRCYGVGVDPDDPDCKACALLAECAVKAGKEVEAAKKPATVVVRSDPPKPAASKPTPAPAALPVSAPKTMPTTKPVVAVPTREKAKPVAPPPEPDPDPLPEFLGGPATSDPEPDPLDDVATTGEDLTVAESESPEPEPEATDELDDLAKFEASLRGRAPSTKR